MEVQLNTYKANLNSGSLIKRISWYLISVVFFKTSWNTLSSLKVFWLRFFGATVGENIILKPNINIKYPWNLIIGNHCWIGEGVWIDNLDQITLEDHVCISQGAFLECGNHNYKSRSFDLMIAPIHIEQGSLIGAKGIIGPGVTVGSHAVLSLGAVATKDLKPYTVYSGNPAVEIYKRKIVNI